MKKFAAICMLVASCSGGKSENAEKPLEVAEIVSRSYADVGKCRVAQEAVADFSAEMARRVDNIRSAYGGAYTSGSGAAMSEQIRQTGMELSQPIKAYQRDVRRYCTVAEEAFGLLSRSSDLDASDKSTMQECEGKFKRLNAWADNRTTDVSDINAEVKQCWADMQRVTSNRGAAMFGKRKNKAAPTQESANAPNVQPSLVGFDEGDIPELYFGRWDEIVSDKCDAREARYEIKRNSISYFEVKMDVVGVKVTSPVTADVIVTGNGDDGQFYATYKLEMMRDRIQVDGAPLRRCPTEAEAETVSPEEAGHSQNPLANDAGYTDPQTGSEG